MAVFNEKRLAFVVIGDRVVVQEPDNIGPCGQWMRDTLRLPDTAYETFTRGYILKGRIQFFTAGPKYAVSDKVTAAVVTSVWRAYRRRYGEDCKRDDVIIGNGCVVGEDCDQWPPILVYRDEEWHVA